MKIFHDMDDNQFWLTLWTLAFTIVMALFALVAHSSANEDVLMADMINKGYDPVEMSCLFNSGSSNMAAACLLIAQAKAKILLDEANVSE